MHATQHKIDLYITIVLLYEILKFDSSSLHYLYDSLYL